MPNALFIDLSNLNVLFKYNDKFVLGANYNRVPSRIMLDAQALGSSFDIYLSMYPRPKGDGDIIVPELSVGAVPFVALREELNAAINLVEKIPGANNIYLCNALANYVVHTRVNNFKSVIHYGSRIALVSVENKILSGLECFSDQQEFFDKYGADCDFYGDVDLVDVDGIVSQYPELTDKSKLHLVPIAPLIASYRSNYKVDYVEVKKLLGTHVEDVPKEEPEEQEETKEQPKKTLFIPKRPPIDLDSLDNDDDIALSNTKKSKREKPDVVFNIVSAVACLSMFVAGFAYKTMDASAIIASNQREIDQRTTQSYDMTLLSNIYSKGTSTCRELANLYSYANKSGLPLNVLSLETDGQTASIVIAYSDVTVREKYDGYLSNAGYITDSISVIDESVGADGKKVVKAIVQCSFDTSENSVN